MTLSDTTPSPADTATSATSSQLRLVSWNVNGLRAAVKKEFFQSVTQLDPDILLLQERFLYNTDPRIRYVLIFKNFGKAAGGSMPHTHTQICHFHLLNSL